MAHSLPPLPYAKDALEPHISAETLSYHHGKHHAAYVNKLNDAVQGTPLAEMPVEEVVQRAADLPADQRGKVFNNAAQHFNHSFYWKCMSPSGGGQPTGALAQAIDRAFGSFDAFKEEFTNKANNHFASGWAWLVKDASGNLKIVDTHDADTPIAHDQTPLLTCDVWEHAYYVDYRNARPDYTKAFWNVVNWDFVASNL